MPLRHWPIRRKLTTILLGTSGLVLLLTSAAFATYQVLTIRRTTTENLATLGRIVAANATASLAFANETDAAEVLSALATEPHIIAARLYDIDGRVFARYPDAPGDTTSPPPPEDGYRFVGSELVGAEPVVERDVRLGTLALVSDTRGVTDALNHSAMIAAAILGISLLAAWLLATSLQGRISQPLVTLAQTARAVSERADYSVRAPAAGRDEIGELTDAFNHMLGRIEDQESALSRYTTQLEERVANRTQEIAERNEVLRRNAADLTAANAELDAFAYSVSHDLRAPLRSIDGFSMVLLEDYGPQLDEAGRDALHRVRAASQRMAALIDDLLKLARVTRTDLRIEPVDLSQMVQEITTDLQRGAAHRQVQMAITPNLVAEGDARLLRVALENLLGNSWKYTGREDRALIEFGTLEGGGQRTFFVRDNGVGFDMAYQNKLFGAFQRLHSAQDFEGTGIGLATVRRIINRHGGRIWADGAPQQGATFYFTL